MTWIYQNAPLDSPPPKAIGFVYLIYNTKTKKSYIGKKLFKHRRNKKSVESDWKTYTGSNKTLNEEIKSSDPILQKTILQICYSKSQCNYLEAFYQFQYNAILSPLFYNDWMSMKVTKKQLQSLAQQTLNIIENNS